jgi:transcription elongation factor/antiterminator RfaH
MEHWYALYTKPKKEIQVAGQLEATGVESYLPTVLRKVRRRDRPHRKVYFPCYLFARLDLDITPRSSISWMPGIRHIVSFGEQPAIVKDDIVELVRVRLDGVEQVEYEDFSQGDRVRIKSGPLSQLEAVFDQPLSSADRVRVLLDVMGRMTPVDIDGLDLERL